MTVPVEPDAPDARDLLLDELSDPAYAESLPTWFDLLSQSVLDWLGSLQFAGGDGPPAFALVVGLAILTAVVLASLLIYGLPRWRRRSRVGDELFGEVDRRSARELRRDADRAAAAGDWSTAIAERFRAIARGLDERTIVSVLPGTTAHGFAELASLAFREHTGALQSAADRFDAVRYLGQPGDSPGYAQVRSLDLDIDGAPSPLAVSRAASPRVSR